MKKIKALKDKFTFEYNNQTIHVEKIGDVHCAIFGEKRVPLSIVFGKNGEIGSINKLETGVFVAKLPLLATFEVEPIQILYSLQNMLKNYDL